MAKKILMACFGDQLHKCGFGDGMPKTVTIGKQWTDTMTFYGFSRPFVIHWNGKTCEIDNHKLNVNEQLVLPTEAGPLTLYLTDEASQYSYDIAGKSHLTVGPSEYDDLFLEGISAQFFLTREPDWTSFQLTLQDGRVFLNYARLTGNAKIAPGDHLFFDGMTLSIENEALKILAPEGRLSSSLVRLQGGASHYPEEYPDYHRSPRIIYREPEEKKVIAKPSNQPSKPSEQLARTIVPPLVMMGAFVLITIFQPRGIYIIAMLAVTLVTVIFSVTSYLKNVKKYKADMKERTETYKDYLQRKTEELHQAVSEQRHALDYHYPDVRQIRAMAQRVDARIYEKTMFHHDFLTFRAGLGETKTSFDIEFNEEEFTQEKDELVDAARALLRQFEALDAVPIVTSLMKGPVGYIGQRELVLEQLQLLVMQLVMFHSYHDLQFITIFPEEEKDKWQWMRWLPHASIRDINVRGFVYHERSRDQVMSSFYQILKERKLFLDEKGHDKEKTYFSPHYVVLITDEKLILDHTIMEFFNEDQSDLCVSLVFVQDVLQSLPEHVKTVIDIRDAKTGNILLENGELVNKSFVPDHFPNDFNKEDVSRALAPLNHLQNLKNSIPDSVTFLEMYGVEKVDELGFAERWKKNETYKSLAVPLGLRGKDDIVYLNLHEKAHGPHGLVAGTTGSGKSELIQSYILSLAVNFHPYEVAFLLIDYKGGGMANLFKHLPHLLGTITNLDHGQSMRALASIKAELERRQRLFSEHDVNHINQYQKLYKQGKAREPMPHLFLISDEFAELKSEQPEFMKELVSTARIGRSLGIHLILATQKPSGVVDDQIWSNSKFKLALKVQDASDSNEILKTPDAAEITLPGRAYLQVGNNEIYELFQSAWSGATYTTNKDDRDLIDATIYAINDLGQYDILTEDLSGLGHQEDVEKTRTELEAVIEAIHDYAEELALEPLPRPWLPPLPEQLFVKDLHPVRFDETWQDTKQPLRATIGLLDEPEQQAQEPLTLDLTKNGHLAVFSSPGYGKSTFLQTLVMDLARQKNPEQLHVYLLDFGTNGLLPLKDLPHVADTLLIDDTEKIERFMRLTAKVMKERKQKLSEYGVASIGMYEQASGNHEPHILFVLDNYDTVRDADFAEEFERLMAQVAREGAGIGIYLAISAGRQGMLRMPLITNIKTQIALYLIDPTEVRTIVGKTDLEIEEVTGRGLIKLEEATVFQTMLPTDETDSLARINALKAEALAMRESWMGECPEPIPMVPEVLVFDRLKEWKQARDIIAKGDVAIAVDTTDVMPISVQIDRESPLKVVGDDYSKTFDTVRNLIDAYIAQEGTEVIVIDTEQYNFSEYAAMDCNYGVGKDYFVQIYSTLDSWFSNRKKAASELRKNNASSEEMKALMAEMNRVVVTVTDIQMLKNQLDMDMEESLIGLLKQSKEYRIDFIMAGHLAALEGYDNLAKFLRESGSTILFSELKNQNVFNVSNRILSEKNLLPYEAYYIENNMQTKIKTAKKEVMTSESV